MAFTTPNPSITCNGARGGGGGQTSTSPRPPTSSWGVMQRTGCQGHHPPPSARRPLCAPQSPLFPSQHPTQVPGRRISLFPPANTSHPPLHPHLPKDHVLPIQPRSGRSAQEELAAVGVGPSVGHGQDPSACVLQLPRDLVLKLAAIYRLPPSAGPRGVAPCSAQHRAKVEQATTGKVRRCTRQRGAAWSMCASRDSRDANAARWPPPAVKQAQVVCWLTTPQLLGDRPLLGLRKYWTNSRRGEVAYLVS